MIYFIKQFLVSMIAILAIDYVWLQVLASNFYISNLRPLLRIGANGTMNPLILPGLIAYVFLVLGIILFVIPRSGGSPIQALVFGAIFGIISYGIYDMTNMSTLSLWPVKVAIVDMLWGGVLCGFVSFLVSKILN